MVLTKKRRSESQPQKVSLFRSPTQGSHCHVPDLHGASIIDASGREIPITESMIQRTCQELIKAWEQTHPRHVHS